MHANPLSQPKTSPIAAPQARVARRPGNAARPKVLVLAACCNGAPWIGQQIDSILEQEGVDLQIAVRDDGSTDSTPQKIAGFAADTRIRLSPRSKPTGSAAQNFLTLIRENAAAGSDYIAFADQDDVWHRDKLARACRILAATRAVGYSSAAIATWPDGRQVLLRNAPDLTPADFLFEGAGQGCTFVFKADFYSRLRRFLLEHASLTENVRYHDWMVYAVARSWGERWVFDPTASVDYRQHGRNDTGARCTWAGARKRFSLIRCGWYRDQLATIATVCAAAAPGNLTILGWRSLFLAKHDWQRKLRIARFSLRYGRRRPLDCIALSLAALAGWI